MAYMDWTDAEVIALTRERRAEAKARKTSNVVRFSAKGDEFTPSISCGPSVMRSKARAKAWRRQQWREGNRTCFYCQCQLQNIPRVVRQCVHVARTSVTVDHRQPIALGGDDAPWNYAMCCWACNNAKGALTEAEFRSVQARLTA